MIVNANAFRIPLADTSVQCVVTSPPYYWLRDYQVAGQIGLDLSMKYLRENAMPRAELSQTPESIATLPLFGGDGDESMPLKQDTVGNPTYTGFNARWKDKRDAG